MAKRLTMSTPRDVRKAITRVANMVLNGEIEARDANAIMYGANIILGAIRVDEQEKKLEELERLMEEMRGK